MSEVADSAPRQTGRQSRVPPHDLQAEESLLGAMMLEAEAIATAAGMLRADDFYKPANAHIFDAIHALYASGQPVDPVTVADELRRNGLIDIVGGHQALVDVMASTPATTNAAGYARIIEEHALLRRLIGVAGEIAEIGYSMPEDITKALDRAESMVYDVNQRRVTDTTSKIEDLLGLNLDRLEQLYGRGDAITGTPTGYVDLDELLSGLQPSTMVIVGARPSMGKCVAWDTPIVDAATGELRTAAEVHAAGEAGEAVTVLSLADDELVPARPRAFVDDGRKPVFRVRTASGHEVRTTASHPFLTPEGWQPLADLAVGRQIGVPTAIPVFGHDELPLDEVVMLAHLVAAPGRDEQGPRLWTDNREVAADAEHRGVRFGVTVSDRTLPGGGRTWDVFAGAALYDLARTHGVVGDLAERRVPRAIFRLPRDLLARFLNRVFGVGASVWQATETDLGGMVVTSRSEGLVRDLRHLLLRFGVGASVRQAIVAVDDATWVAHELVVDGPADLDRLAGEIGVLGQEAELGAVVARARGVLRAGDRRLVGPNGAGGSGEAGTSGDDITTGDDITGGAMATGAVPADAVLADAGAVADPGAGAGAARRPVRWDPIVAIEPEGDTQVYDLTIPDWHNFVAADVLVHNTAFGLGMAAHAALHANRPVLLFSLEMGSLELSQRLLCGEARIDSTRVRTGRLAEDDWGRISQAIGRLASAPIWIDDNPNLTVMEIRAKARRLKSQVGDLGMVIIDYLQLMTGRSNAENRQVEVSEISRGLKILARELECPVVALSQLSRQLEMRADKRPMLADLRESGCLTADARVLRADTGAEVTIGELAASGERDIPVWSLDTDLQMVPATMTHAFPTGVKETFELLLASGRSVTASANHPFLTVDGWSRLDELAVGARIAVPRHVPAPKQAGEWPAAEVVTLAHWLGAGSVGPGHERFVPDAVHALTDDQVALFLRYLWAAGGCVDWSAGEGRFHFATSARRLAEGVQQLLVRLGIRATLRTVGGTLGRPGYRLQVDGRADRLRFVDQVGAIGPGASTLRERLADVAPGPGTDLDDTVPVEVWSRVRSAMAASGVTPAGLAAHLSTGDDGGAGGAGGDGSAPYGSAPSRARLAQVAELVDDDVVRALATSDVSWDRVVAIQPRGPQPVFDATVESTHNFVANGIVVENSIEQDADVVMFIYRDDVYHSDSPDRGQAEVIVAKHRNGPTGVCRLAFLSEFTRFANMAKVD